MRSGIGLGIALILVSSCSRASHDVPSESSTSLPSNASSTGQFEPGAFRVANLGTTPDGTYSRYMASTGGTPPTCQFELRIEKSSSIRDARFAFAEAAVLREPGSDCTMFLRALAKHLGFNGKLPDPAPVDRLAASLAILGVNQSRSAGAGEVAGSFSSTPPGNWTAMKLFLADGEGEVFLNINARDSVGEFSIKDEDYATIVVTELAKILLPKAG
jgi:hypothetical protein